MWPTRSTLVWCLLTFAISLALHLPSFSPFEPHCSLYLPSSLLLQSLCVCCSFCSELCSLTFLPSEFILISVLKYHFVSVACFDLLNKVRCPHDISHHLPNSFIVLITVAVLISLCPSLDCKLHKEMEQGVVLLTVVA